MKLHCKLADEAMAPSSRWVFLAGAGAFCAIFLASETFRAEIIQVLGGADAYGRPAFEAIRLGLLITSMAFGYLALPGSRPLARRQVPLPVKGYDPLLTMRALACMSVLLGHGLAVVFNYSTSGSRLSAWPLMGSPWAGVWMFFVLSGYLMAKGFYSGRYGLSQQNVRRFYKNRLTRIAPVYYVALVLVGILVVPEVFSFRSLWELIALAAFSQHNAAPTPIIGALWSVQTEMAFYAMVPLFFIIVSSCMRFIHPVIVVLIILTLGFLYRYAALELTDNAGWNDLTMVPLIANLDLFLVGMAANWFVPTFNRLSVRLPTLGIGLALMLMTYFFGAYMFSRSVLPSTDSAVYTTICIYCGQTFIAVLTLLIVLLFESSVASGVRPTAFSLKCVRYTQLLGVITYPLYVWHEPIFKHLRAAMPEQIGFNDAIGGLAASIILSLVVAFVAYRLIEAPFEKKKPLMPPEAIPSH